MKEVFSNRDLKNMILPLFCEQLLVLLVGIMDTFVISYVGEAAVSGVSLVNMFNTVFIYIFTALASGGAVIISQYIGKNDGENAAGSASQLLFSSTVFSIGISVVVLAANQWILRILFGRVETQVMAASITYLRISAYSYPALAVYNAGAAIYRSMGKTSVTMYISIISNLINAVGNLIGVFILQAGVAGVAYPTLMARFFSAAAITVLCMDQKKTVHYERKKIFCMDMWMQKRILRIAVPNGIENGVFQLVKVALGSVVALFGTYQIAANGIAQSIWSMAALIGSSMTPVFITVIGQCMGAEDIAGAEYYFKKLLKITLIFSVAWNMAVFLATPVVMRFYAVSEETRSLVIQLVLIHNIFNTVMFPFSGPLSGGLRAAGDVKFTMCISMLSTIGVRLILSVLFGIRLNMGVIGIAIAMCMDWTIRAVIFFIRFRSGVWKKFKVI